MKINKLPPLEYLNECFAICNESPSGLIWKFRPRSHFLTQRKFEQFNARHEGNTTGFLNNKGYYHVNFIINGIKVYILVHRLVYAIHNQTIEFSDLTIDHIDKNPSNNNPNNLRAITHLENMRNRTLARNNISGINGVSKDRNRWRATVRLGNKYYSLGAFKNINDAARKRKEIDDIIAFFITKV